MLIERKRDDFFKIWFLDPYPMSTFERMVRYIRYGFMPCRETKLKIARAIHGLQGEPQLNSKSLYDGVG